MDSSEILGATIFANVKSKLTNFHASDLLPSFGFLKRKLRNQSEDSSKKPSSEQSSSSNYDKTVDVVGQERKNCCVPDNNGVLDAFAATLVQSAENSAIDNVCQYYLSSRDDSNPSSVDCCDSLQVQHFGTYKGLRTLGKARPATGHVFEADQLNQATFCDKCGDFIWGLYKQAIRCQRCQYVCHYKCEHLVTLDCRSDIVNCIGANSGLADRLVDNLEFENEIAAVSPMREESESGNIADIVNKSETIHNLIHSSAVEDIIKEYNAGLEQGLKMLLDENSGSIRGFVQIYMNLARPVSVVDNEKPSSIYDVISSEDTLRNSQNCSTGESKTITSFYLPRGTVKILHIDSDTTTRRLIAALLRKFKVADNPLKFALYERDAAPGQTLKMRLRRISDDAHPLRILLQWGSRCSKSFVLQENDTGDIIWEYFAVPELETFLKILEKEEDQYIAQIKRKYDSYRFYLQFELQERGIPINYVSADEAAVFGEELKSDIFSVNVHNRVSNVTTTIKSASSTVYLIKQLINDCDMVVGRTPMEQFSLDFSGAKWFYIIMITIVIFMTTFISLVMCDCCMEEEDEDAFIKKNRKGRTTRHGRERSKPRALPGGMVDRHAYATLVLIDNKLQASYKEPGSPTAASPPHSPPPLASPAPKGGKGHYIDMPLLPQKVEKVAANQHGSAKREKFVKAAAYGTLIGIDNVMKASKH